MAEKNPSPDIDKKKGELSPREAAAQEYETGQRDIRRGASEEDASERKSPEQEQGEGGSRKE